MYGTGVSALSQLSRMCPMSGLLPTREKPSVWLDVPISSSRAVYWSVLAPLV